MFRKEKVFALLAIIAITFASAQEKGKFKFGTDLGLTIATESLGLQLNFEPKYNITDDSSVGLRAGLAVIFGRKFDYPNNPQYVSVGSIGRGVFNLTATYEKYLGKENSRFQPYVGAGIGYFILSQENDIILRDEEFLDLPMVFEGTIKNQIGVLLRGGIQYGKFRFGLEYNFIPTADITLNNGDVASSVKDSYFGVSIGGTIGGGKWFKKIE